MSNSIKLEKLGIDLVSDFGKKNKKWLQKILTQNKAGKYTGYQLSLPDDKLKIIGEKATVELNIDSYDDFPNGFTPIRATVIHYEKGGKIMDNKEKLEEVKAKLEKAKNNKVLTDGQRKALVTKFEKEIEELEKEPEPAPEPVKVKKTATPKAKKVEVVEKKKPGRKAMPKAEPAKKEDKTIPEMSHEEKCAELIKKYEEKRKTAKIDTRKPATKAKDKTENFVETLYKGVVRLIEKGEITPKAVGTLIDRLTELTMQLKSLKKKM